MEKCTTMFLSRVDTELYWCETAAVGWVRWEEIRWRCSRAYEDIQRLACRFSRWSCWMCVLLRAKWFAHRCFCMGGSGVACFRSLHRGAERTIGMSWCLFVATRWSEHGSIFHPTQQTPAEPRASRTIAVPPCAASAARPSPAAFADLTTQGPRGGQPHAAKPKGPT